MSKQILIIKGQVLEMKNMTEPLLGLGISDKNRKPFRVCRFEYCTREINTKLRRMEEQRF